MSTNGDASAIQSAPVKVSLQVTSDTICPWCYIGFAQINRAVELAKEKNLPLTFDIEFTPYLLDPTLPTTGGVPKVERLKAKLGEKRALGAIEAIRARGKDLGINFVYEGVTSQTTMTHRLLSKAYSVGGQDMQQRLLKELFKGYFEEKRDVGDIEWLATSAEAVGLMNKDEAEKFLNSSELRAEVAKEISMAQRMGIDGVPFTIINRKWALSGAQPPEVFLQIFEKVAKESAAPVKVVDGMWSECISYSPRHLERECLLPG